MPQRTAFILVALLFLVSVVAGAADPASAHRANVFLRGEPVSISPPGDLAGVPHAYRVLNERLEELKRGTLPGPTVDAGALPTGWYRIEYLDARDAPLGFTTAAVLEPRAAGASVDSPIALDVALAWLGAQDQGDWELLAGLAKLAGAHWVRDRIHWREMQEASGAFAAATRYDRSADIQSGQGLQVLQVFHTRPKWALLPAEGSEHPRTDLLKLYTFCRGMAERFQGRVQAWEPWNEGNAANFGGFTVDELCTLQKAAYLGFKAGDPDLTVCWNPLGGINLPSQARGILQNETWPYFDVYSIHAYDWPHAYEELWAHARDAASGRPLWVTECDRGMTAAPDSRMGDFSPENDCRKAEFIAQSYVRSLFSGASRHFHFILGHYMEGENRTQFGLLREDHTPRPSYVALAAVGRLLAGAQCLGRHEIEGSPNVHVYAFRASPHGEPRDVLVAWTEGELDWPERGRAHVAWPVAESLRVEAAYDYLGRPLPGAVPDRLSPAAVFLVLPEGEAGKLAWRKVAAAPFREGDASPVVLQFDAPDTAPVMRTIGWTQEAAYEFAAETTVDAVLAVYNLGLAPVTGAVALEDLPSGWSVDSTEWRFQIAPMAREEIPLRVSLSAGAAADEAWLNFRGDFGSAGKPRLAVRSRAPRPE